MLTFSRAFQLLATQVEIRTNCERLQRALDYVAHCADQDYPVSRHVVFEIARDGENYSILQDGARVAVESSPAAVVSDVFVRINVAAFDAMPAFIRLHAGSAEYRGRRFLVVGTRATGKTTLMLRMLFAGWTVFGDELVMLRDGVATPFPRRFHVKPGTPKLLPEIAALAPRLPYFEFDDGYRIIAFDPRHAGFEWRITSGQPDVVLFATGNHDGPTRVRKAPKYALAQDVMTQTIVPDEPSWNWIGDLCGTLNRARCYRLELGDLDSAVRAIKDVLA